MLDPTLAAILGELFRAHQQIDALKKALEELQRELEALRPKPEAT